MVASLTFQRQPEADASEQLSGPSACGYAELIPVIGRQRASRADNLAIRGVEPDDLISDNFSAAPRQLLCQLLAIPVRVYAVSELRQKYSQSVIGVDCRL